MRRPSPLPALLSGLLLGSALVLGACDSGETGPDTADALVGSWAPDSVTNRTLGTATRDLRLVDFSAPGTGTLAVTGDVAGPLRYVYDLQSGPDYTYVSLFSSNPNQEPTYPALALQLDNFGYARLTVFQSNGTYEWYDTHGTPPLFTYADERLTVPSRTLTDSQGRAVTVGGTLDLVARAIQANAEGLLSVETAPFYLEAEAVRYAFDADGTFHLDEINGDVTHRHTGTWERLDDTRVRVTLPWEGGTETTVFTVRREGNVLTLAYTYETCEETPCLDSMADQYRLAAGSFSRVRWEYAYRFTPAEEARPAGRLAEGAPSGTDPRELLWPRRPATP